MSHAHICIAAAAAIFVAASADAQSFRGSSGAYDASNVRGWTYQGDSGDGMDTWFPNDSRLADGANCVVESGPAPYSGAQFAAEMSKIDAAGYRTMLEAQGMIVFDVDEPQFIDFGEGYALVGAFGADFDGTRMGLISAYTIFGNAEVTVTCGSLIAAFQSRRQSFLDFIAALHFTGVW